MAAYILPRPSRILFLLNSLRGGGAEKQVLSLLHGLDTEHFTLSLAYLRREEQLLPQVPSERLEHVVCCDADTYLKTGAVRRLAAHLNEFQPDVVVCTNLWSLLYANLARVFARTPFAVVEVFHTTLLQTAKQKLQMHAHRPLFARSDLLVYVCENQRRFWHASRLRARDEAVIHNGIDVERFADSWSPEQKAALRTELGFDRHDYVLGLCAAFRPEKAHADLLQAVATLRQRGVPAKALLIGDGGTRPQIEQRARELGIDAHVRITGFQQDVRPYIAIADVMTLMSHGIETFSLAALEAMAMGKPMVMTRVGGAEEQVRPGVNGFLFEPGDIAVCVRHLEALAEPGLRQRLGSEAARLVRRQFSLQQMVAAYSTRLAALCKHSRRTSPSRARVSSPA